MQVTLQVGSITLLASCAARNERRARSALRAFGAAPGSGSTIRFGWSALRLVDAPAGDALAAHEPDFRHWPTPDWTASIDVTLDVIAQQLDLLGVAGLPPEEVAFDQYLLCVPGALDAEQIFARRTSGLSPEDSGWLVGTTGNPEALSQAEQLEAVMVAALVAHRPGLLQTLALPLGSIVVLSGDSVVHLEDGSGRELPITPG